MGGVALGTVRARSRGLASSRKRPEAVVLPQCMSFPTVSPAGHQGLGIRGLSKPGQMETTKSCQAQGAMTSQEIGPVPAFLFPKNKQATEVNCTFYQGAPPKCSSQPGDMVRAKVAPGQCQVSCDPPGSQDSEIHGNPS